MKRRVHLNLFIQSRGHHEASWRHPLATPLALTDIEYFIECAEKAEAAKLDSIFLADSLILNDDVANTGRTWIEPITALGALAVKTSRIGLIATASTTYTEPFNLARQFASIDHMSKGRAAWNIVTTYAAAAGRNFGDKGGRPTHAGRYDRGDEFVDVCKALWDSWGDDAVVDERKTGRYAKVDRIRPIEHRGAHYSVAGPLNIPRCPQGRPVLVQAGSSETGRSFAARHAEAVFTAHLDKASAQAFYKDLKARVVEAGRPAHETLILPGLSAMIGATEAEARRRQRELNELAAPEVGRKRLSLRFDGRDFSHLPLDKPLSPEDFPDPASNEGSRSRTEVIVGEVRRNRPTLRQLLATLAGARGHFVMAGTPEQVADHIEDWVDSGAADGFNLMPPILPAMLDAFTSEVLPILRRRGRFRTDYQGTTLRDHYGLTRPCGM